MGLQEITNALLLAGIYACVGMGFSLLYGVMNIVNLAHGAMVMLGAYISFWLFTLWGVDPFLSIPASALLLFAVGYPTQSYLVNNVIRSDILRSLLVTYGVEMLLLGAVLVMWGSNYRAITPKYFGLSFQVGPVVVPYLRAGVLGVAAAMGVGLSLFMSRTRIGLAIRATALNKEAAALVGIDISRIYAISSGIGCGLAGAAGTLVAVSYTISPSIEGPFLGSAFVIAILGGLGSMMGAVIGGVVLAMAETLGAVYFGMSFQRLIGFVIFLLVLIFRPHGLVGKRFYAEI